MQTRTQLGELRKQRGLSVAELARQAGISRQTVYAMEDGSYVPNTAIALKLARLLETSVEELFLLEGELDKAGGVVRAELLATDPEDAKAGTPVRLAHIKGRLIAVPVAAVPAYLPASDGFIESAARKTISVKPISELRDSGRQFVLAGCDPALSFLTHILEDSGFEIVTIPCASRRALEWLKEGRVHAAGSHLLDHATGDYNVPIVKRLFPRRNVKVITFALWEEGLVLSRGNPKSIRAIGDLSGKRISIVNREKGSGSRSLLDEGLRKAGMKPQDLNGYDRLARGHLEAALAVATGTADCCIATRSAAGCFGLDFVPLSPERFDLCLAKSALDLAPGRALLDALNRRVLRKRLEAIGYDATRTGDVLL